MINNKYTQTDKFRDLMKQMLVMECESKCEISKINLYYRIHFKHINLKYFVGIFWELTTIDT